MKEDIIKFNLKEKISRLIKVIGVGGAGSNAVNYMYESQALEHVDYIVCNTDLQALNDSPVPTKIQIGKQLTDGLGAGSKPETGKKAALENLEEVKQLLENETKMLFITAGMGGGTGTGAAPEIARLAKEMGILTVAIVTMPFRYEGPNRLKAAEAGIRELRKYVDSLLIVDNEKLIEVYGDLPYTQAFNKSDEVLAKAVKSVSQVITTNYHINVDFNDVETILRESGTALIGTAEAGGEDRAVQVIKSALDSPLLNDNNIEGAKNVLLLIISGAAEASVKEIEKINKYVQSKAGREVNIIMGLGVDPSLGDKLAVTLIATGFPAEKQKKIAEQQSPVLIVDMNEEETETDSGPEMNIYHDHADQPSDLGDNEAENQEIQPGEWDLFQSVSQNLASQNHKEHVDTNHQKNQIHEPVEEDESDFFAERFGMKSRQKENSRILRNNPLTAYQQKEKDESLEQVKMHLKNYTFKFENKNQQEEN